MKNFFAFIGVVVVVLVGVGIWQGWYKFAVTGSSEGEKKVVVEANVKKAGDDIEKGYEATKKKIEDMQKKDAADGQPASVTVTAPQVVVKPASTSAPAGFWAPVGSGK